MVDSWESSNKRKSKAGRIVIGVCLVIGIGVLSYNNLDFFRNGKNVDSEIPDRQQQEAQNNDTSVADTMSSAELQNTVNDTEIAGKEGPGKKNTIQSADTAGLLHSVALPTVICMLADEKSPPVQVSLKLYFTDSALEREILFKRDAIVFMVKKIFAPRRLDDIIVDELRTELQKEVNTLLKQGAIVDIEFLDFRPAEKK